MTEKAQKHVLLTYCTGFKYSQVCFSQFSSHMEPFRRTPRTLRRVGIGNFRLFRFSAILVTSLSAAGKSDQLPVSGFGYWGR